MKGICQFTCKGKWITVIIFNLLFSVSLYSQDARAKKLADSLNYALPETTNSQDKIVILKKLINLHSQQPDSISTVYTAMAQLGFYYYTKSMPDSLQYWTNRLLTLCEQKDTYPDVFFIAGYLRCKSNLKVGNYELAMNEAILQLNQAEKQQQPYGLMRSNQSLGLIYQAINHNNDAFTYFQEGLTWLQESKNIPSVELQYLSDMIKSGLYSNRLPETEKVLDRFKQLIDKTEKEGRTNNTIYPVQLYARLYNSYMAELYTRKNDLNKAGYYIEKASKGINNTTYLDEKFPYYQANALYNYKSGNNNTALKAVNNALAIHYKPDLLKIKINIMKANGQYSEAINLYDKLLAKNTKMIEDAFNRQMNQLRTLNDLNDRDKQSQELEYQNEQLATKQYQLTGTITISVILLVLLFIANKFYQSTQQLKNELLCEKKSLVKSEKQLRIAKNIAEEANLVKSNFISNISYEIRTPLNSIVGFSMLLSENRFEEKEKSEFTATINKNAEQLLNLVNNVLELSRLESGNTPFPIQTCNITDCCQTAIDNIKHYIAPGVKLSFNGDITPFTCQTVPYRIQQVVSNLLSNAAKFTTQGEINLTLKIDRNKKEAQITVTDTGCGIPKDKQSSVFEYFEKLNEFTQGTGLGLPICLIVANNLGGNLLLDANYTNGAQFIFTFPFS